MAKPEKRKRARELRRQGWKIIDIAKELDVRRETASRWCLDIELSPEQVAALGEEDPQWLTRHEAAQKTKKEALAQRLAYQEAGRERARQGSDLHLLGCMLYWGEGAKARNHLQFINTDSHMLKLFMRFLRDEFQIRDKEIYLTIMHHTSDEDEINRIEAYWLDWLSLSSECGINMQLKKGTESRKMRYQNGICSIAISNTEILQHIFGAIQEYIGFDNPDWAK